jgi:lysophospholipase
LLQGRSDCIERYFETIVDLQRRGFAVAAFDWRGQGGSERRLRNPRKGHIDSFGEYDRDLDAFMSQVALPDCPPPHFALAHSTGGLICLRGERDGRTHFTRLVLTSPLVGLGGMRPSPKTVCRIATLVTALGLGELTARRRTPAANRPATFDRNPWSGDAGRLARNAEIAEQHPQLAIGGVTFGWLHAACRAMADAADPDFAPAIRVPTLVAVGSLDTVVSLRAIEMLVGELRAGALVSLPGARHELLMEQDTLREEFFAAFDAFVPGT